MALLVYIVLGGKNPNQHNHPHCSVGVVQRTDWKFLVAAFASKSYFGRSGGWPPPQHSPIAQLAEYGAVNTGVPGSSPGGGVVS